MTVYCDDNYKNQRKFSNLVEIFEINGWGECSWCSMWAPVVLKLRDRCIWRKTPKNQQQQNSFGNKYQSLKEIVQE